MPVMATARTTSTGRVLAALVVPLLLLGVMLALESTASARSTGSGCTGTYGWPVKPFDEAHPIRGGFGDPRTVFRGPRTKNTLLTGGGGFSFHQGLDISAPDGSPVYAVSSGTVVRARGGRVTVECGNGRTFQYWHIEPAARVGQHTIAGKTLLGFIQPKREHVHLTHLEDGRAVNPLAPRRLSPYRDATTPDVLGIATRRSGARLALVAEAVDMPSMTVPGRWRGFPVTPARITWRIEDSTGHVVVANRVARDVRRGLPRNDRFWGTFARGVHQNWPVFDGRKERGLTGRYLFRLTRSPFDTRSLRNGTYVLVVTAEDIVGNAATRTLDLRVANTTGS